MITNSDDETNFPHELLLSNRQFSNLHKCFANNRSASIKLSKTQLFKIVQSCGFFGTPLNPLPKTGLPLMKNVTQQLAKSVLISLGLTAPASIADSGIHKTILNSGTGNLIISNDEMEDIMKIVKSLENSFLLLKGVSKTIQNEAQKQKRGFLSLLLGPLGSNLSGNMLSRKGAIGTSQGQGINRAGDGIIRARYTSKRSVKKILILLHPLTNLELETLIVLSVTSGNISIASFSTVIGAPVGIASVRLGFEFPITIGIVKNLFK